MMDTQTTRTGKPHGPLIFATGQQAYAHLAIMAAGSPSDLEEHLIDAHGFTSLPVGDASWCRRVELHAACHRVEMTSPRHEPRL